MERAMERAMEKAMEKAMETVYLSLGSNLGNRHALLLRAIDLLARRVGRLVRASSFIETEPWGFSSPHPFLNAAVCLQTTLTPHQLLAETQAIERQLGRTSKTKRESKCIVHSAEVHSDTLVNEELKMNNEKLGSQQSLCTMHSSTMHLKESLPAYTDRPIDIDILLYGDLHLSTPDLTIPHPLMHLRDFVLRPLQEIMP